MQKQTEITKINCFIEFILPIVAGQVKTLLKLAGLEYEQQGQGADFSFLIKKGSREVKFFMNNLLYEIATIDRDEKPLRFDSSLRDFNYFQNKANTLIQSKLRILFELFAEDNVDSALERVTKLADQYQRVRIIKLDRNKPTTEKKGS